MTNTNEIITTSVSVVTGTYALANIQDILSVIILVLSILNILWNFAYRLYKHIKNKEFDKISEDIEETQDKLTDLKGDKK